MGRYSRRKFLQLSGTAYLSSQLSFSTFSEPQVFLGRTFDATPVYRVRNQHSEVLNHLWPDSIVNIYHSDEHWYQLAEGYVQRTMVQPMMPYSPHRNPSLTTMPFWAEVAAPVASVRQWCAPDAPLVTRIGHGGVAQIVDYLSGNRPGADWYGVATQKNHLLGWTKAICWRPVQSASSPARSPTLQIDRNAQILTGYDDGELVFQMSISTSVPLMPGNYPVSERQSTGATVNVPDYPHDFHGAPWRVYFGEGYELSGVYWHNRFGSSMPGPNVQVPTRMAHWLYDWLGDHAIISVE